MGQGKFAEACPKLASSYQPAEALAPKVGKLRLVLDPQLARTPGLDVRLDGAALPIAALTTPLPVDAGEHEVQVSAPDKRPWQGKVICRNAVVVSLRVPVLANAPVKRKSSQVAEGTKGATQRITAIAVGGLGMVALGAAGFCALSAESGCSDSNSLCSKSGVCSADGYQLRDDAKSKGTTATALVGAGAVALATAGVLWFTVPSREKPPSQTNPGTFHVEPHPRAWGLAVSSA